MKNPDVFTSYAAPFWLLGGHLQTIIPSLFHQGPDIEYHRERWELDDGDFIDVDWTAAYAAHKKQTAPAPQAASTEKLDASDLAFSRGADSSQPVLVIFHGLEGDSQSQYVKSLLASALAKGWLGVVIHFRGCSGTPNRLPRTYYAGDSADIELMLARVRSCYPHNPLYAVGYSLGGNALLKWLGELGHLQLLPITKAVAVSAPMDLKASAISIDTGINRIFYSRMFLNSMRPKALALARRFPGLLNERSIKNATTIQGMDDAVTAVLYGANSALDYYNKNAAKPYLKKINLPTLIINAKNDPFMPAIFLPTVDEVSTWVTLDYQEQGGHVGFFAPRPRLAQGWLAHRIVEFLDQDSLSTP
jgi:predicted alpha/beta-fold hydrolase